MSNVADYEASTVDWSRLKRYARRVAKETSRPHENPISYTTTHYVDVPKTVPASGLAGAFGKTVNTTERQQQQREVVVVGKHWKLGHRHHHIERNSGSGGSRTEETTHEQHHFVLLPDGAMKLVVLTTDEVNVFSGAARTSRHDEQSHLVTDIGERDLRSFDFEETHSENGTHGMGTKTWGTREPGPQLLVTAKGIGLSNALKRLLPELGAGASDLPAFDLVYALGESGIGVRPSQIAVLVMDEGRDRQWVEECFERTIEPFHEMFSRLVEAAELRGHGRLPLISNRRLDERMPGSEGLVKAIADVVVKQAHAEAAGRHEPVPEEIHEIIEAMDWAARECLSFADIRGMVDSKAFPGDTFREARAAAADVIGESIRMKMGPHYDPADRGARALADLARYKEQFCSPIKPQWPDRDARKTYIDALIGDGEATAAQHEAFKYAMEWDRIAAIWNLPVYEQMRHKLDEEAGHREAARY